MTMTAIHPSRILDLEDEGYSFDEALAIAEDELNEYADLKIKQRKEDKICGWEGEE
jgi:hypothetical protein